MHQDLPYRFILVNSIRLRGTQDVHIPAIIPTHQPRPPQVSIAVFLDRFLSASDDMKTADAIEAVRRRQASCPTHFPWWRMRFLCCSKWRGEASRTYPLLSPQAQLKAASGPQARLGSQAGLGKIGICRGRLVEVVMLHVLVVANVDIGMNGCRRLGVSWRRVAITY